MPGKHTERYWNVRVSYELKGKQGAELDGSAPDPLSCEMSCAIVADSMIQAYDTIQEYLEGILINDNVFGVEVWSIEEFTNPSER